MPSQPHPSVLAVHHAASVVLSHVLHPTTGSFWRRWFEKPDERHFADEVRAFVVTLDYLLDVPPQMLTPEDIVSIGQEVDRVVKKVEAAIEEPGVAGSDIAGALAPAVYVIRARYEELYRRGATGEP
jgi:hypothetical protein